jgi:hypothetical protein
LPPEACLDIVSGIRDGFKESIAKGALFFPLLERIAAGGARQEWIWADAAWNAPYGTLGYFLRSAHPADQSAFPERRLAIWKERQRLAFTRVRDDRTSQETRAVRRRQAATGREAYRTAKLR